MKHYSSYGVLFATKLFVFDPLKQLNFFSSQVNRFKRGERSESDFLLFKTAVGRQLLKQIVKLRLLPTYAGYANLEVVIESLLSTQTLKHYNLKK